MENMMEQLISDLKAIGSGQDVLLPYNLHHGMRAISTGFGTVTDSDSSYLRAAKFFEDYVATRNKEQK